MDTVVCVPVVPALLLLRALHCRTSLCSVVRPCYQNQARGQLVKVFNSLLLSTFLSSYIGKYNAVWFIEKYDLKKNI